MKNSWLLYIMRAWTTVSLIFLCFMIIAHLFGEDNLSFNNWKEVMLFSFFPLGVVFGLILTFRLPIHGGLIILICTLFILFFVPELVSNWIFLTCVLPGPVAITYGALDIKYSKQ